jgi:flagellar protein FliT
MNSAQIIGTYEAILVITNRMLEAAQNSDWDSLVAREHECRRLTEELIANGTGQALSGELQQRKVKIIRQVLADDAEIRTITEPWMTQLQNILGSAGRAQKLHQAYGPGGG